MTLRVGNGEAEKKITKGCPQGSVVGTLLWNVLFSLKLPFENGVTARDYAYDAVLLMKWNTSQELMRECTRPLDMLMRWEEQSKLTFSKEKTGMMLKGKIVDRIIKVDMAS